MKIHARQHIPNFVDIDERKTADVSSVDELLAMPWIAQWAVSWPDHDVPYDVISWPHGVAEHTKEIRHVKAQTFHRWSHSSDHGRDLLMVEYDQGDHFYVVAYLTSDEPIDLPEWHETENARMRREKWNRGDTS